MSKRVSNTEVRLRGFQKPDQGLSWCKGKTTKRKELRKPAKKKKRGKHVEKSLRPKSGRAVSRIN